MLVAVASLHPTTGGVWVVGLVVAAFTYATTFTVGVPAYFLFRHKNWFKWWQFGLGGALLGVLPTLVIWFPALLQGLLFLGPEHPVIGAISGVAFWAVAYGARPSKALR